MKRNGGLDAISGIYLGAMAKEYYPNEIKEWGEKIGVPIYTMRLDDYEYKLLWD